MAKRILVTGAAGMLGREIVKILKDKKFDLYETDILDLDITDREKSIDYINRIEPSIIINTAAYTDVDGAEKDKKAAMNINGDGPGNLAKAAADSGALLVHFSTDYIFDGKKNSPYTVDDKPNPLSTYGKSKLKGEEAIIKTFDNYLIIRSEWLFGQHGKNFIRSIINAIYQNPTIDVVKDQIGSPTYAEDLAEATLKLIKKNAKGIVNFTNSGETSWFDFARFILSELGIDQEKIKPINSKKSGRPAKRPAYSVLDLSRYIKLTGKKPPDYKDATKRFLKSFLII